MDSIRLGEALWAMHLDNIRALERLVENSQTRGESGVLLILYHVGHSLSPGELTEMLCLTTGRVANLLRNLEGQGLVQRLPAAADKRRIEVSLTPRGECVARYKNDEVIRYHARLLSNLEDGEAREFLRLLKRMVGANADCRGAQ